MKFLKIFLPLLVLMAGSAFALADYNPADPPEPGVNFMLTAKSVPEGSAYSMTSSGTRAFGTQVDMYANANTNFRFVQWEDGDGNVVSTTQRFYYTMPPKDVTLIARFVYDPSSPTEPSTPEFKDNGTVYLQATPSGAGSFNISSGETYEAGASVRIRATPKTNYTFVNWTRNGEVISESSDFYYTVLKNDQTLVANFEYSPGSPAEPGEQHFYRTLTLQSNMPGAATLYGGGTFEDGTRQRVYLSGIKDYYTFVNWTDDEGVELTSSKDFYFTMPNRNVTLTANFSYDYNPSDPAEPGTPNPDGSIADNMVLYPRFGMYDETHVMILCETPGSTIHYTIDGTDPTTESTVYTEPFYVESNVLVKAYAVKEGMEHSPIRSYQVTAYKAAAPVFTFVNRKVQLSSDTEGATIRYTLDFSDPNEESDIYTTPLEPEENCRIKAYASKEGLADSRISVYVYRKADYTMAAPSFSMDKDGKLVITPSVAGATVHYTMDGSDPDADSPVYASPLPIDGNVTVKAYSTHINYFDSPIAEYVAEWHKVARPEIMFVNPILKATTATEGAEIRYTTDRTIPTETSTLYTDSLTLTADCSLIFRAFKENYEPSDTISFNYIYKDYQLPTPTASFANLRLTLTCQDENAQIHYTTDADDDKTAFLLYKDPLELTSDCTVRFYASRQHFNDSEIGSFVFAKAAYQVATPRFEYNGESKMLKIETSTEGAYIRYNIGEEIPSAETGTLYEDSFPIEGNFTITARAFKDGLFDSEYNRYSVSGQRVPTPTAKYGRHQITLECEDEEASIHYAMNDNEYYELYENPIQVDADCTIRFYATRRNLNDSETGSFEFILADYKEAGCIITKDFRNRKVNIESGNLAISVEIDGQTTEYQSQATINVLPLMRILKVVALASSEDRYDSDQIVDTLTFHLPPVAEYNGHEIKISADSDDPEIEAAETIAMFNSDGIQGSYIPHTFGEVMAHIESDHAFKSDTIRMPIDYFNDGVMAGAINGHRLSEAFADWHSEDGYTKLAVFGETNRTDLEFLAGIGELAHLQLSCELLTYGVSLANALAGSNIECVSLKSDPEGILGGMPRLTSVYWNPGDGVRALSVTALGNSVNPNLLLWVADNTMAPAEIRNVVVGNHAENITLTPGYPFRAHSTIDVDHIELTKDFTHSTIKGVSRGWESLVLPFAPDAILHKEKGEIIPYSRWEQTNANGVYDDNGPKPFWIYEATDEDWQPSEGIEAGKPYIISMPNNPDYIESYNLAGEVTFSANDVRLETDEEEVFPMVSQWIDGMTFNATFMPMTGDDYLSLNSEWTDTKVLEDGTEIHPGSVFTDEAATLPFEAYVAGHGALRQIPVFRDANGVALTFGNDRHGVDVEVLGQGAVRLVSYSDCLAAIHTVEGALLRTVSLKAGADVTISNLLPGIYIIAGRKILVK